MVSAIPEPSGQPNYLTDIGFSELTARMGSVWMQEVLTKYFRLQKGDGLCLHL